MSITGFKKHIAKEVKIQKEYKEYLKVCIEDNLEWYQASKTVMEYLHPNDKLTAKDYTEINKLRSWYKDQQSEDV